VKSRQRVDDGWEGVGDRGRERVLYLAICRLCLVDLVKARRGGGWIKGVWAWDEVVGWWWSQTRDEMVRWLCRFWGWVWRWCRGSAPGVGFRFYDLGHDLCHD
jgi:hypothetical protein